MNRAISCLCLIVMLIFCGVVAAKWGISSVIAYPSISRLEDWREHQQRLEHGQWEVIRAGLVNALSYDPQNPELLHKLGLAYEGEFYYILGNGLATDYRKFAYEYYQEASAIRPAWPYHWVDLLLVKYRLGEIDEDFNVAIKQAVILGPWEPWVQQVIADVGMHHWYHFTPEMQQLVNTTVRQGVQHLDNAKPILELVKRYDMFDLICLSGIDDLQVMQFCERNGYNQINLRLESDIDHL